MFDDLYKTSLKSIVFLIIWRFPGGSRRFPGGSQRFPGGSRRFPGGSQRSAVPGWVAAVPRWVAAILYEKLLKNIVFLMMCIRNR